MGKDLTGQKFGRLTVIGVYDKKNGRTHWKCKCDCGNIIPVYETTLKRDNGTIKSCGCVYIDELKKEIGTRKDHLEIIGVKQYGRKGRVVVRCDCGNVREMILSKFKRKEVHSCGCIGTLKGAENQNHKHGMSRTRIYNVYRDMYNRCYNPDDISYPNYGEIGIKICDEWLGNDGVINFCNWAYENGYKEADRGRCTLDRVEVDGDYSPDNCRWTTMKVQSNNKRNNLYYTIDGQTKTLSEWCDDYNLCVQSVYGRLKRGMDIKTALTKPMQKRKKDMTEEEIAERKQHRLEMDRKWRAEHKEQVQASREKWKRNNPDKAKKSWQKYNKKRREQKTLEEI